MEITRVELRDRIELHDRWLKGYDDGVRLDLSGANLIGVDMIGADLRRADLSGTDLGGADLSDADLGGADLSGANLTATNFFNANLIGTILGGLGIPVVPNIDAAILAAIGDNPDHLNMDRWHTCQTTHCRAGWAITLAGQAGKVLEVMFGSSVAGTLIYAASRPGKPVPNFYASNAETLADLRESADAIG